MYVWSTYGQKLTYRIFSVYKPNFIFLSSEFITSVISLACLTRVQEVVSSRHKSYEFVFTTSPSGTTHMTDMMMNGWLGVRSIYPTHTFVYSFCEQAKNIRLKVSEK